MRVTYPYDTSYYPAAPFIEIGIGPSDGKEARLTVRAFVDSGADATMIPLNLLKAAISLLIFRILSCSATHENWDIV